MHVHPWKSRTDRFPIVPAYTVYTGCVQLDELEKVFRNI